MQRVLGAILILLGLCWLASQFPVTPEAPQPHPTQWRRTCDGWQRANWLSADVSRRPPALHPALVGLALLLFTLAALTGLSTDAGQEGRDRVSASSVRPRVPRE
jgi:hypothetical protein